MSIKNAVIALAAIGALGTVYAYKDDIGPRLGLWGADGKKEAPPARVGRRGNSGPVAVTAGAARRQSTPRLLATIGTIQAFATVNVKSRVDGQLFEAHFTEGQTVRKGDLLFRIDPRPFEVQLRQAQASLARDRAQMEKARGDQTRYASLVGKGFASQQKYEEARAAYAAIRETLRAGEAAIEAAKLQLAYTEIRSPIDGRTGSLLVNTGNLVKANDSGALVVITQVKPVHVVFSVPEAYLPGLKRLMAAGPVAVGVRVPGDKAPEKQGRLVFINNAVDTATGTIQLKAVFPNEDDGLTPGEFVNVAVTLEQRPEAVVVPSQAVQDGQRGAFVFVIRENSTVDLRTVTVDDSANGFTVVTKGLEPGEKIVLDGYLQLRPNARVVIKTPGDTKSPGGRRGGGERKRGEGGKPSASADAPRGDS